MPDIGAVPPGRAGRLWLRQRLAAARRGADLMDRKVRVLRERRDRFQALAQRTQTQWERAGRAADGWLLRAALVGGERELWLCAATTPAQVEVTWESVMGVACPVAVTCALPEPAADERSPGSGAVVEAGRAVRAAVRAAAAHAAAAATVRVLDAEMVQTRRRLRAITTGRIPRLEAALGTVTAQLEEGERAELMRLRWAAGRQATTVEDETTDY
jgi:V/A-type H+-transporting ATPase subunit D